MNSFYIEKEPYAKEKYYIAVKIFIYRNLLGRYPNFLSYCEHGYPDGLPTKFVYLVDGTTELNENDAREKCEELEHKYSHILRECENSGDWSKCPFDFGKMELLWSK